MIKYRNEHLTIIIEKPKLGEFGYEEKSFNKNVQARKKKKRKLLEHGGIIKKVENNE